MAELTKNKYLEKINKNISSIESITKPLTKSDKKDKSDPDSKSKSKPSNKSEKINKGWQKVISKTDELFSDVEVTEDNSSSISDKLDKLSSQIDRSEARTLAMNAYVTGVGASNASANQSGSSLSDNDLSDILKGLGIKGGATSISLIGKVLASLGAAAMANPVVTAAVIASVLALKVGADYAIDTYKETEAAYDELTEKNGLEIDASTMGGSNTESIQDAREDVSNTLATVGKSGIQKAIWHVFSKKDDLGPNILDPSDLGKMNIDLDEVSSAADKVNDYSAMTNVSKSLNSDLSITKDEFNYSDPLGSLAILCAMYLKNSKTEVDKTELKELTTTCIDTFLSPLGGVDGEVANGHFTILNNVVSPYLPLMADGSIQGISGFLEMFYEVIKMSELDKYMPEIKKSGFWGLFKKDNTTKICLFRREVIVGSRVYHLAINPDSIYYQLNHMAIVNRVAGRTGFNTFLDSQESFDELKTATQESIEKYISARSDLMSSSTKDIQDMLISGDLSEDALLTLASENAGLDAENKDVAKLVRDLYDDSKKGVRKIDPLMSDKDFKAVLKDYGFEGEISRTDLDKVISDFNDVDRVATNTKAFTDEGMYDTDVLAMKYTPWDISSDEDASESVKFKGETIQEIYNRQKGTKKEKFEAAEKEILEFMQSQGTQGYDISLPMMDENHNIYFNESIDKEQSEESLAKVKELLALNQSQLTKIEETSVMTLNNTAAIIDGVIAGLTQAGVSVAPTASTTLNLD